MQNFPEAVLKMTLTEAVKYLLEAHSPLSPVLLQDYSEFPLIPSDQAYSLPVLHKSKVIFQYHLISTALYALRTNTPADADVKLLYLYF